MIDVAPSEYITVWREKRLTVLRGARTKAGYKHYAFVDREGSVRYMAGCRNFTYEEATKHWSKSSVKKTLAEMSCPDLSYAKARRTNAEECLRIVRGLMSRAKAHVKKVRAAGGA